jgi:Spy/CpxP family protein refolding chaperone
MKKTILIAMIAILSATIGQTFAQQGTGQGMHANGINNEYKCMIPGITDDQQKKIDALKITHQKQMLDIRNQILEKEARFMTITTGDKINKDEALKIIDEISTLKTVREKAKLEHRLAIRSLLNDEQKLWFDMRQQGKEMKHGGKGGHGGMGHGNGQGQGYGRGNGQGNCQGYGNR